MNKVYNINFVSHLYTTKAVLESMYKRNHGHIVSMGSAASYARGLGIGDYHATKRGVLGYANFILTKLIKGILFFKNIGSMNH